MPDAKSFLNRFDRNLTATFKLVLASTSRHSCAKLIKKFHLWVKDLPSRRAKGPDQRGISCRGPPEHTSLTASTNTGRSLRLKVELIEVFAALV